MYQDQRFAGQVPVSFRFCGYDLMVPSKHPLIAYHTPNSNIYQPYRDGGLGIIAAALTQLGRQGVAIDIGANVGDTLAIIASNSDLKIICVEASDFFAEYLRANIDRHFKDRAEIRHAFVAAQPDDPGHALLHWGGTARPIDKPFSESSSVVSIGSLLAEFSEVALLKIDTDGFDLAIIEACLEARPAPTFPIYFEMEITSNQPDEVRAAAERSQVFFNRVVNAGYRRAFVWDDPGRFYGLIDLADGAAVTNLLNYMTQIRHRPVWGFDICLVHDADTSLLQALAKLISINMAIAVDCSTGQPCP
ncbi:MAG: FkbM family methyltransferase [Vitreimonas sp.]